MDYRAAEGGPNDFDHLNEMTLCRNRGLAFCAYLQKKSLRSLLSTDRVVVSDGGILLPPFLLSSCDAYTSPITLCFSELQVNPFFGHSFYSFPYSLEFRVKRYHWFQWELGEADQITLLA